MKQDIVVGIDPGEKGSISAILPSENKAIFIDTTGKVPDILEWFNALKEQYNLRVIMVEDVSSLPGVAAGSNFKFGFNVGTVTTIALATGCMVDVIRPKAWQKEIGVSVSRNLKGQARKKAIKNGVGEIAKRLYPSAVIHGPKGGLLDGRSDALMIGHSAILKYGIT